MSMSIFSAIERTLILGDISFLKAVCQLILFVRSQCSLIFNQKLINLVLVIFIFCLSRDDKKLKLQIRCVKVQTKEGNYSRCP